MSSPNVQVPHKAPGPQRPRPLRIVRGPDGKTRVVRRGAAAFAALQANIPKVLRIGVIQGARIVEERIIRKRETVTVGPNEKNHFVVPNPALPSRHPLFEMRQTPAGEQYYLTFLDDMTGRVAFPPQEGGVQDFGVLRSSGKAVRGPKGWQVPLTEHTRGKVVVGDTTMLFQFVVPPPVQPPPRLPASVRGGWIDRIEGPMAVCFGVSAILHIGLMVFTLVPTWPKKSFAEILDSEFAQMPIPVPEAEKIVDEAEEADEKEAEGAEGKVVEGQEGDTQAGQEEAATAQETKPGPTGPHSEEPKVTVGGQSISQRQYDAIQAKVQNALGVENILGGGGSGPAMGIATAFGGSSATVGNLQDSLAGSAGVADGGDGGGGGYTTMAGSLGTGPAVGTVGTGGGSGTSTVATVTATRTDATAVDPSKTEIKRGKVRTGTFSKIGGSGTMNRDVFMGNFRRKMSGIEQCYNNALVRDPTLEGSLLFMVVINQQGGVSADVESGDASLDAAGVTDCIRRKLASMNFASNPPQGGDFRVRLPFTFVAP